MSNSANLVCGLVFALLFACGHSEETTPSKPAACTPGTGYSCYRNGCNGHQRCLDDGSAFTPCECNDTSPKAGQAGPSEEDGGLGSCDSAKGLRCSPAAPSGWQGPVALRTSEGACAAPFDVEVFDGGDEVVGEPARCESCSCEGDASCASFIDFRTGETEQCGGDSCATSVNQSCAQIAPTCVKGASSAYLETSVPAASTCKASPQHADIPEAHWQTRALACRPGSAPRAGCNSDELCLPAAISGGFEAAYCIWQDGDQACPDAIFTHRRSFHRAFKDTRACSACSCSASGCEYRWRIFNADDNACASPILELKDAGECVHVNLEAGKLRVGAMISGNSGPCRASGGESRGEIAPDQPVTVCCSSN